jgi:hypothetical protein
MSGIAGGRANPLIEIPDSNYSIRYTDDGRPQFVDKKGTALGQQEFLEKVGKQEISLTANSLRFLEPWLGPDKAQSLRGATTPPLPSPALVGKVETELQIVADIWSIMEMLAKFSQDEKKLLSTLKQTEDAIQIELQKLSADQEKQAAFTRAITGFVTAALTIASGIASGIGTFKAEGALNLGKRDLAEILNTRFGALTKGIDGASKAGEATGGLVSANQERDAKEADIQAQKFGKLSDKSREMLEAVRDLLSRVLDALRSVQQSETESRKSILRS